MPLICAVPTEMRNETEAKIVAFEKVIDVQISQVKVKLAMSSIAKRRADKIADKRKVAGLLMSDEEAMAKIRDTYQ